MWPKKRKKIDSCSKNSGQILIASAGMSRSSSLININPSLFSLFASTTSKLKSLSFFRLGPNSIFCLSVCTKPNSRRNSFFCAVTKYSFPILSLYFQSSLTHQATAEWWSLFSRRYVRTSVTKI